MDSRDFEQITAAEREEPYIPPQTLRERGWQRMKQNRLALGGMAIVAVMTVLAVAGPWLCPYTYDYQDFANANAWPSPAHWFGTDSLGRDLLVRVLYGARISLSIGLVASVINVVIGVLYGGIAGLVGGRTDRIMMHIVDVLYSIPMLLYVILLMVVFKPGLLNIYLALGIAYWLAMARIVRGQILSLKQQDYVLAARSCGASTWQILRRHMIPNCVGPIIVTLTLSIPDAIFTEAFLSFIGLGVAAPMASWGVLASEGIASMRSFPFQLVFPAIALSVTMLGFMFLGDGLRDALDPQHQKGGEG
ncbi:ABC transporter permease [uncultured Megasphaera sp.]|uniref:ABC transporter permease n=1 Tax=uncultured Megasphaera sp. TaxID=165188 RepID=UPI00265AB470|nr:ABC transporter permease [uncultured Megasphaera sp.]